jgi:hypothetical protein
MVKVAFIVEGKVEKLFIDSLEENGWFTQKSIKKVAPTIDAKGGGNLCPQNMQNFVELVMTFNPDKIFILTDLECDPCVEKTKERLGDCDICVVVLAKKAIEAWFLADSEILKQFTNEELTYFDYPEKTELMPYEIFKNILMEYTNRGTSKIKLAKNVFRNGFDIERVARHPERESAKYFVDKIKSCGE